MEKKLNAYKKKLANKQHTFVQVQRDATEGNNIKRFVRLKNRSLRERTN